LAFLMLLFLGIVLNPASASSQRQRDTKQNFLLITIDTLRADRLGCYGSRSPETPNIDQLAERSVLFSRAFANTSTTLPSHANILLGTTPNFHGIHENLNFVVNRELLTLAEHLKDNGYSTGAFVGAYPLDSRFGLSQGFDIYDDNYNRVHTVNLSSLDRKAEAVVEAALDWLEGQTSPWFLWIHCWDPHTPYDPPEPFKSRYSDQLYEGEVAYVDSMMGRLFDFMEENSLFDSTLVVLTGDHGESLGQHGEETHGYFAYNSSLWIPLIISLPNTTSGRVDDSVSHIDIFPTVCETLGIEAPAFLQGSSLLPALKGKKIPERPIYFESLYPYYSRGWAPLHGFIHQEKKYIDSPIPELYDLSQDFDELQNLAGREKTASYASKLVGLIQKLTPAERVVSVQQADRETREKLASLGYVSSGRIPPTQKKEFDVKDDVKVMLPYTNRINEGWKLYKSGQQDAGIKLIQGIFEERKDIDMAYKQLASIYQETGNTEEAIAILEQGLIALPSSYEIYIDYMKVLISDKQYDRVIQSFEKISIREAEYDPEIWNNLGTAYARKGDLEMAIKAFEMGLSLDDNHPELYNNLANASYSHSLKMKDPFVFTRCFEYYKKAIELDPGYPAPYYGLGHAYREEGNLGGAIYCWQKTLELDPGFKEAHLDLAIAYLNTGDKAKAQILLDEYKKLYYDLLPDAEKETLDALIEQCRKRPH
jgi:arylsulfatase A-like enzyme/Flp pilus assembly protein TadD